MLAVPRKQAREDFNRISHHSCKDSGRISFASLPRLVFLERFFGRAAGLYAAHGALLQSLPGLSMLQA